MPNQPTQEFRCTIKRLFNGCPKSDGWFGCFAHVRGEIGDIKLTGNTTVNLVNGMQLDVTVVKNQKFDSYDVIDFSVVTKTKTGLVSYLASLSGVSKDTARAIVMCYGEDALDEIKANPQNVKLSVGLTDKQLQAITDGVNKNDAQNDLRKFLPELSAQLIRRVKDQIPNPKKAIKDNPYILHTVPGISFPVADTIALRLGIHPLEAFRVNHGLIYILETESNGHLFINLSDTNALQKLCNRLESLLRIRFDSLNEFGMRLMALSQIQNSPIIIEHYKNEYHLYLTSLYLDMISVVGRVNILRKQDTAFTLAKNSVNRQISKYETYSGKILTKEQRNAVETAMHNKICIVTGGPGRGKTAVIDCIAHSWKTPTPKGEKPREVLLLAPTGKAMNKLRTATNAQFETMTIDKLIVTAEKANSKAFDEKNNDSTLIIIDESSMLDIAKIASLMNILSQCQYCFVGDIDQLPPISPGHFLKNLIDSGNVPTAYLTVPLRNGGLILSNAEKINNNDINLQYDFTQMPFYPQEADNQAALDFILEQYNEERINCPDITQIALLSPMKKGILGTVSINIAIQDIACPLNPNHTITYDAQHDRDVILTKGYPIASTIYGNGEQYTKFRIGDIVLNTQNANNVMAFYYEDNDYWNKLAIESSQGVFNGDCGRIIGYVPANGSDDGHDIIIVQLFDNRFIEIDLSAGEFEHFELGYAMTVHKSQGCEYQTVIYVSPKMLLNSISTGFATKNLVYTAVTRAKEKVVIIGSKEALNECIMHNIPEKNSNVQERVA